MNNPPIALDNRLRIGLLIMYLFSASALMLLWSVGYTLYDGWHEGGFGVFSVINGVRWG